MKSSKGKLIVIVAPSGSGKSTLMKRVRDDFKGDLFESISYTTRRIRPNEEDGVDYFFIEKSEFQTMIDQGDFVEWALVHGDYKGTSKTYVNKKLNEGADLIFDLDVQGTDVMKETFGDKAIAIFIKPPSFEVLEQRLRSRGTDSEQSINTRLKNAKVELERSDDYDYSILNDDIDLAYNRLKLLLIDIIRK